MSTIHFRSLFEAVPGLHIAVSPDFTIVAVSNAYVNVSSKKREELVGRFFFDVFPDSITNYEGYSLRGTMEKVLQDKTDIHTPLRKYEMQKPDGSLELKYWSTEDRPVFNDKNEIEYILHTIEDITDLVRSEHLFSTIFEHNPACIALSRVSDAKLINVNQAFVSVFGFSRKEEVLGKTSAELNLLLDVDAREKIVSSLQKGEKVIGLEGQIRTSDGNLKWISTSIEMVTINEEQCLLATLEDITAKKEQSGLLLLQTAQLKQANEELETFSYSVSHDLKAPLRSLEGFSKLLLENYGGKFDEEADRWLRFIASNANKMGILINDILNFSRISRSNLNKNHINMQLLAEKTLEAEKTNYPNNTIEMHIGELSEAYGDMVMLGQVWQNLISNALKYSSKNDLIVITVDGKTEKDYTLYSIKDNGVGFDEKYKDKLFGVFQRLHRSDEFEGTGVGLAIVNRIIQKHEGWIEVTSTLGKGTEFTFALPVYKA